MTTDIEANPPMLDPHPSEQTQAPLPVMPALPDSITKRYDYRDVTLDRESFMLPKQGANCPLYEPRVKP